MSDRISHATYARIHRARVAPERVDELRALIEERVLPRARAMPGFAGMLGLYDPATGQGQVVTLWEDADALVQAEMDGHLQRRIALLRPLLESPIECETCQVLALE